jgi:EAL domain-containing protein (putative c-di-GMP-specific phosphodiesterase class I)
VRWDHPDRGRLLPEEFLRIADETGLIVPLDLEVIGRACRQGARWHRTGLDIRIAVNLSGRTLTDDRLLPALTRALDASGLPATSLELELTESGAVADSADVIDRLSAIRALGVSIAVDDLGTGYASLGWIRSFPIDRIKIDRSFVADLTERRPAATLVEGILTMARRLDCAVVAEGIETPAQVEQLLDLGCAEGQGYLFGGPVTGEAFRDVIRIAS